MAQQFKCVVATVTPYLRCRTSPGLKSNNIASMKLYTGNTFMSSQTATGDGIVWYKNDATGYWSASTEVSGKTLLKVYPVGETNSKTTTTTNKATTVNKNKVVSSLVATAIQTATNVAVNQSNGSSIASESNITAANYDSNLSVLASTTTKNYEIVNSMNFPINRGTAEQPIYDYTTDVNNIRVDNDGTLGDDFIQEIRENLNIYSAWSRQTINNKYHTEFNRFKLDHPDIFLRNSLGYIVFTRPDLNLLDTAGNIIDGLNANPRVDYIARNNLHLVQCLTHQYDGTSGHNFNPFLSNLAQSLEVMDDSVDTLDTGETFTGYKFQYSKHNVRSITAGSLNIKFKETFDLGITNLFQLWVDYQSNVYKGVFVPKDDYIYYKNIDYMCNIYYFLLDQDGENLLFWSKYFGVFPVNVPKSTLSYDAGSQVQLPDMQVSFSYIYREDLSPTTLVEFNADAGIQDGDSITYLPTYNADLGHSGRTWAGVPFISSFTTSNGLSSSSQGFKLRFRAPSELSRSRSSAMSDADAYTPAAQMSTMTQTELTDRELVKKVAGLSEATMKYLDEWGWASNLYKKAAQAIRGKTAAGMTGSDKSIVQSATGLQDETMVYLTKWTYGSALISKLANAMRNGA